ncbi:hypothetical protein EMIT0194MI4_30505 [Pseudomonas sp. IT-194MI4]
MRVVEKSSSPYKPYFKSSNCGSHIRLKFLTPKMILKIEYVHRLWMIPHFDARGWRSPQKNQNGPYVLCMTIIATLTSLQRFLTALKVYVKAAVSQRHLAGDQMAPHTLRCII